MANSPDMAASEHRILLAAFVEENFPQDGRVCGVDPLHEMVRYLNEDWSWLSIRQQLFLDSPYIHKCTYIHTYIHRGGLVGVTILLNAVAKYPGTRYFLPFTKND